MGNPREPVNGQVDPHRDSNVDIETRGGHASEPLLINTLLSYTWFSLQSSANAEINRNVLQLFDGDKISVAKDELWDKCSSDILGPRKNRRDTAQRTEIEADVEDIINGLQKLDQQESMPVIALDALKIAEILPMLTDQSNIGLAARVASLETGWKRMQIEVDRLTCENIETQEKLNSQSSTYAKKAAPTPTPQQTPVPQKSQRSENTSVNRVAAITTNKNQGGRPQQNMQPPSSLPDHTRLMHAEPTQSLASTSSQPSQYKDGFTYQKGRHSRNRRPITGKKRSSSSDGFHGAPEPSRDIFIYRVRRDVDAETINNYLLDSGIEVREIVKMSNEAAKFKSFRAEVKVSDLKHLMTDELWPKNVRVRMFTRKRENSATSVKETETY